MSNLASFVERKKGSHGLKLTAPGQVVIVTQDGRLLTGVLKGLDQTTNIILTECVERIIYPDREPEMEELGLYIMRGDNVVLVGEVDMAIDAEIDWNKVRGDPLGHVVHMG